MATKIDTFTGTEQDSERAAVFTFGIRFDFDCVKDANNKINNSINLSLHNLSKQKCTKCNKFDSILQRCFVKMFSKLGDNFK